jgi:hypothetical protein
LGLVLYESNILGTKGPRKMKVLYKYIYTLKVMLPKLDVEDVPYLYQPKTHEEGITTDYR